MPAELLAKFRYIWPLFTLANPFFSYSLTKCPQSSWPIFQLLFPVLVLFTCRPLFYLPRSPGQFFIYYSQYLCYLLADPFLFYREALADFSFIMPSTCVIYQQTPFYFTVKPWPKFHLLCPVLVFFAYKYSTYNCSTWDYLYLRLFY
jgi:hypothetical protein